MPFDPSIGFLLEMFIGGWSFYPMPPKACRNGPVRPPSRKDCSLVASREKNEGEISGYDTMFKKAGSLIALQRWRRDGGEVPYSW